MADTPAETPKRRRNAKATEPKTAAPRPAARSAKTEAPKTVAAKKPPATKHTRKTSAGSETKSAPAKTAAPRRSKAAQPKEATAAPTPSAAPAPSPAPAKPRQIPEAAPRLGWAAAIGATVALGGAWFLWRASRAEEPAYQTIEQDGSVEVRKYPSLVTAGTSARGEREAALNDGFRTLADYLFAKSRPGPKLSMTAPVLADREDGSWRIRFVMPTGKAKAELPAAPGGVELVTEPAGRFAAIRFSGRADDAVLDTKEQELRSWLQTKGYPHEGRALHAFYNAPFLPGPMRRNEVLIMLSNEGGVG